MGGARAKAGVISSCLPVQGAGVEANKKEKIMSADISTNSNDTVYPVLPLRDIVVFPHMIVPLFVGREKSISALEEVMKNDKQIMLVTQKDSNDSDPKPEDIYEIGTLATVLQLPDGTVKVLVEGASRARVTQFTEREDYFEAF